MARPLTASPMLTQKTLATLDAIRAQGVTYQKIADALGISYATTYRAINRIETYRDKQPHC